jgi:hypothetical protein
VIKMTTYEETKEALEGAIKKWELIYAGVGFEFCDDGCPLEYAGYDRCESGPYLDWYWHHRYSHDSTKHPLVIKCAKCTEIALNMINYLKSLRPVVDEMFEKTDKRKVRPDTSDVLDF